MRSELFSAQKLPNFKTSTCAKLARHYPNPWRLAEVAVAGKPFSSDVLFTGSVARGDASLRYLQALSAQNRHAPMLSDIIKSVKLWMVKVSNTQTGDNRIYAASPASWPPQIWSSSRYPLWSKTDVDLGTWSISVYNSYDVKIYFQEIIDISRCAMHDNLIKLTSAYTIDTVIRFEYQLYHSWIYMRQILMRN